MSEPVTYGYSGSRQGAPKPCFVVGTPLSSGSVQTGDVFINQGGQRTFMRLSGITADTLIVSGAGRLVSILPINNLVSGTAVLFYDSAVATSGGPFSTSGHKVVGVLPAVWHPGASGVINQLSQPGNVGTPNMPFFSGLCCAALASGTTGFTVCYTPETSQTWPNPA